MDKIRVVDQQNSSIVDEYAMSRPDQVIGWQSTDRRTRDKTWTGAVTALT